MNKQSSRALIILLLFGMLFVFALSSSISAAAPEDVPQLVVKTPLDVWTMEDTFAYWADQCAFIPLGADAPTADSTLQRKPLAGGAIKVMDSNPSCFMYSAMAADESGVYYTDKTFPGTIFRFGPGSQDGPVPIATNVSSFVSKIVLDDSFVYWIDSTDKINRVPKTGGQALAIIDADKIVTDLAVDGGSLYWMEFGGNFGWAPDKNCGSPPCAKTVFLGPKGYHLTPSLPAFAGDPPFMYYVEGATQELRRMQCRTDTGLCSYVVVHDAPDGWSIRGVVALCIPKFPSICTKDTHIFLTETKDNGVGSRLVRASASVAGDELAIGDSYLPGVYVNKGYVYFAESGTANPGIYRLPFNAAPIEHDLQASAMEVTQAIQNLDNEVPIIAAKPTYVRVYADQLKGPRAMSVEAWLYGTRNGQPLPGSPLKPLNGPLELLTGAKFDRAKDDGGWLFKIPNGWTLTAQLDLEAVIDPRAAYADNARDNNHLAKSLPVSGEPNSCIFFSPVSTHTPLPHYSDPNFWPTLDRYVSMWPMPGADVLWWGEPIEELETCWYGIAPYPCFRPYELDQGWDWDNWFADRDRVIATLIVRQAVARVESPFRCLVGASVHSVGMVHPEADTTSDGKTTNGYANLFFNASWTKFPQHNDVPTLKRWNWPDAGSTLAQEITHNFWRNHVNCNNPEGVDNDYPYDPCTLDDRALDLPVTHFGLDSISHKVIAPNQAADFMSYGANKWVSDYTYKGVKGEIGLFAGRAAAQEEAVAELAQASQAVIITGFYEPNLDLGRLNYAYTMDMVDLSLESLAPLAAPRYNGIPKSPQNGNEPLPGLLILKNAAQQTLDTRDIQIIPSDDHSFEADGYFFAASFPAPTQPVALVQLLVNGKVVAEMKTGSGLPQVTILQPAAGAKVDQPFTISWQASDPDGDTLLFQVLYSPDGGLNWFPLVSDYPGSFGSNQVSLTLQFPENVPGSSGAHALLKVVASDGFNSSSAVSNLFTVANKKPLAFISQPAPGQFFDAGEAVPLGGSAYDPEDGSMNGADFAWKVDGAVIESGATTTAEGLAPGLHQALLAVEDSDGNKASATAEFTVLPLQVPFADGSPVLDGRCDDTAYAGAKSVRLAPYGPQDGQAFVRLLRTETDLWACFAGLDFGQDGEHALAALLLDGDYSRMTDPQSKDMLFGIYDDGSPHTAVRSGGSAPFNPVFTPAGFSAQIAADNETIWHAELRINSALIAGWNGEVGLGLMATRPTAGPDESAYWPNLPLVDLPPAANAWAHTLLAAAPIIDSLEPDQATVGGQELILTVTGRNFTDGAKFLWNGQEVETTFNSDTELTAKVKAAGLKNTGNFSGSVTLAQLPLFPSNERLVALLNPQPQISTLTPDQVDAGSEALTLVVKGQDFVNGSAVLWDGAAKVTTFISPTELRAAISKSDLRLGGNIAISVANPEPAQGVSNAAFFRVEPNAAAGFAQPVYMPFVRR